MNQTAVIDVNLLPLGHVGFERLGRLCRTAPHLKLLAFEALLHAPLVYLLEPGSGTEPDSNGMLNITPLLIRWPQGGVPELSNAVFSDIKHFRGLAPEREVQGYAAYSGHSLIEQMLAFSTKPLVADPLRPHAVCFSFDEVRKWWDAWSKLLPSPEPYARGGNHFRQASQLSQVLLDRLAAFFSGFESVERAYLMDVRADDPRAGFELALMVKCHDGEVFERIRRAMPLLRWGLDPMEAPQLLLALEPDSDFERHIVHFVPPVYDRAIGRWIAPVGSA